MSFRPFILFVPILLGTTTLSFAQSSLEMEEVIVTADFFGSTPKDLATSVTVLNSSDLQKRGAENLQDLLGLIPNVNFATGASRGRFLQIRGIGERSEFVEPVNYSVGVIIDGIDFTGTSIAATTLDVEQVEVLRGPQGTLYGANALAGLINIVSASPTEDFSGYIASEIGDFNSQTFKAALGGPLSDSLGYRVAVQSTQSDGFYKNTFLGRDDTNNIDEQSARAKLSFIPSENLAFGLTAYYANIDNGYDVFNYDSNRTTISNTPGADEQETTALALSADIKLTDTLNFKANLSGADSEIFYSFDEDWRNPTFCIENVCTFGPDGYNNADDQYTRDNDNTSVDLRLVSKGDQVNWVVGLYRRDQDVELSQEYITGFGSTDRFSSVYDTENTAIYTDVAINLTDSITLSAGARIEDRTADYADSVNFIAQSDDTLSGGRIALKAELTPETNIYALISKGYKAGGINSNSDIPDEDREFKDETLFNYEFGLKGLYFDGRLQIDASVFFQDRKDIQTDSSIVDCSSLPCSFDGFTANATTGDNIGIEVQANYYPADALHIYTSLGLLDAEYGTYDNFQHVNAIPPLDENDDGIADSEGEGVNLNNRDQPHAPNYQFIFGAAYSLNQRISFDANLEGKDSFFFSNDHDIQSDSYVLINTRISYEADDWSASVWGKNLADKDYQTRGFGTFGNDPSNGYTTELYTQLGDPRTFGISGQYNF